jgi:hypothetical protein
MNGDGKMLLGLQCQIDNRARMICQIRIWEKQKKDESTYQHLSLFGFVGEAVLRSLKVILCTLIASDNRPRKKILLPIPQVHMITRKYCVLF